MRRPRDLGWFVVQFGFLAATRPCLTPVRDVRGCIGAVFPVRDGTLVLYCDLRWGRLGMDLTCDMVRLHLCS